MDISKNPFEKVEPSFEEDYAQYLYELEIEAMEAQFYAYEKQLEEEQLNSLKTND